MTGQARAAAPPRSPVEIAWRWSRENLFSGLFNTLLTLGAAALLIFVLYGVLRFVFVTAQWDVIETNRRLFFLGRFPKDETWRVWVVLYMVSGLAGISVALWTQIGWRLALTVAIALIPVFLFIQGGEVALLTAGAAALTLAAYGVGLAAIVPRPQVGLARNIAVIGWIVSFVVAMYLLSAIDRLLWGGLMLTLILAVVGAVASFPLGVLLALGRASTFPVVRWLCTGYIELIRGVPLITVFFMALFFLPLMVGPDRNVAFIPITGYEIDIVLRAMVGITLFTAAYVAETVRGGLQSVPRGQVEAAQALGLSTPRTLALIVLPQALRAVIPALVGQFISMFKDTSLVFIMGLTELLAVARQVTAQPDFIGRQAEALLFVALIYWVIAFSMSRASQRLEHTLGVGER